MLLMLLIFVIGLSIKASIKLTIIDGATQTVIDFMHQSKVAETRSVKFYASGASISHKVVGDACGEVFTFKDELPYKYKRFIVEVAEKRKGEYVFSIPLFDFEDEMIPEPDFQNIWNERCN